MILLNDDCLKAMPALPEHSVDMILCDLPYGTTSCKWDVVIPFDKLWKCYNFIAKENAAIVLFGSEPFSTYLRMSNISNFKYDWIWEKNTISSFALAHKQPLRNHETISVFYKSQCIFNPIKEPRDLSQQSRNRFKYDFNTTTVKSTNEVQGIPKVRYNPEDVNLSYPKSVKNFNTVPNNSSERLHPTQKPVELLEYLIKTYTNEGMTVLDNCMGSGSTGIACLKQNREFIGIEKDPAYFKIAEERIQKFKNAMITEEW